MFSEQQIIDSWMKNVSPWIRAVREGEITSRTQVTNLAIIEAVIDCRPESVLDVGCGEGWLVRELEALDISAQGIDAVSALIAAAREAGQGSFQELAYEQIFADAFAEKFDLLVCNFSLLGDESVVHLFQQAPGLLNPAGWFIVQSLHPRVVCAEADYRDGWREGSWQGFNAEFREPAPWYFRTIESWQALFEQNGFEPALTTEPLDPLSQAPASIIFSARLRP
jgi:2-polyprenyl-3-methyl-5-hydroxy-6-metoxy-1,4-benzoquinol methylase